MYRSVVGSDRNLEQLDSMFALSLTVTRQAMLISHFLIVRMLKELRNTCTFGEGSVEKLSGPSSDLRINSFNPSDAILDFGQWRLLNLTTYFEKNLKKHCSAC
jgi:hypothetical protein